MVNGYDAAVTALYRAPLDQFVAERKRLSQELKAAGDKEGAARLGKLGRPPLSAWAVNQLWWQARESFDQLLAAAERVRAGDLASASAHRDSLAKLRSRAAALLAEHGHAAPDATLRRVAATLAALAAGSGFDPDPPGALAADRDPPGFGLATALSSPPRSSAAAAASPATGSARDAEPAGAGGETERREKAEAEAKLRRDAEAAEARRRQRELEKERERRRAERAEVQHELEQARARARAASLERDRLQQALAQNDTELSKTRTAVHELEARLAAFDRYERLG